MDLVQDLEQIVLQSETKLLLNLNLNHNSNKSQFRLIFIGPPTKSEFTFWESIIKYYILVSLAYHRFGRDKCWILNICFAFLTVWAENNNNKFSTVVLTKWMTWQRHKSPFLRSMKVHSTIFFDKYVQIWLFLILQKLRVTT